MNYYDVLRVDKNASSQEIKDSYKKLIKRYHPDLYPGNKKKAESITRDLNEAYEVLSDPDKKSMYDLSLQETIEQYQPKYSSPSEKYRKNFYENKKSYDEPNIPSWEDKFRQHVYNYVDKKSENMSSSTKKGLFFIAVLISLLILIITANDYVMFQNSIIEKQKQKELKRQEILKRMQELEEQKKLNNYYDDIYDYYDDENITDNNTIMENTIINSQKIEKEYH